MRVCGLSTKVLVVGFLFFFVLSAQAQKVVRAQAPPRPKTLEENSKNPGSPVVAEYPSGELQTLLKKVSQTRAVCEKVLKRDRRAGGVCGEIKVLLTLETLLKSYLVLEHKYDFLTGKSQNLAQENYGLRAELKGIRAPASYEEANRCYKPELFQEIMVDEGIDFAGNVLFSKSPMGTAGTCWTNSRRKKEATITVCNYPLAIYLKTRGGTKRNPIIRERQYLFALNGCDLIVVQVHDESTAGRRETFLNYDHCMEAWNKRTADPAMTPAQVRLMQDTIGACFRYHLLPPRNEQGGRVNPNIPIPPAAKVQPQNPGP